MFAASSASTTHLSGDPPSNRHLSHIEHPRSTAKIDHRYEPSPEVMQVVADGRRRSGMATKIETDSQVAGSSPAVGAEHPGPSWSASAWPHNPRAPKTCRTGCAATPCGRTGLIHGRAAPAGSGRQPPDRRNVCGADDSRLWRLEALANVRTPPARPRSWGTAADNDAPPPRARARPRRRPSLPSGSSSRGSVGEQKEGRARVLGRLRVGVEGDVQG